MARANLIAALDGLGAGVRKEHLLEIGRVGEQPLRENAGEHGDVHLDEVRQIAAEHRLQRVTQYGMVAADGEHAPATEEIEVLVALAVEQILALAGTKADIVADRLQHADHLLVHVGGVQRVAFRLPLCEQRADIEVALAAVVGRRVRHAVLS